ncbi:hypothetical protein JavanS198_0004 [Streptococcus satellite phage Javan198]|nr:hypothetical protein JavanS198_0004 [Streptococcus satellite phage Javan198]
MLNTYYDTIVICQWSKIGRISYDIAPKTKEEDNNATDTVKARYGAYIQLQDKRYN